MQTCNEKLSDLHMLSLKDTVPKKKPSCMHMTSKRWCTGHSSARGRKTRQNFSRVLRSKPINMGSMVWAWHPWTHPVQSSSRGLLAPWDTHTPCPAALAQLPAHHELAEQHFSKVCPTLCPMQLHCPFSYNSCLHLKWYQVAPLAQLPRLSACNIRCFQTSTSEPDILQSSTTVD